MRPNKRFSHKMDVSMWVSQCVWVCKEGPVNKENLKYIPSLWVIQYLSGRTDKNVSVSFYSGDLAESKGRSLEKVSSCIVPWVCCSLSQKSARGAQRHVTVPVERERKTWQKNKRELICTPKKKKTGPWSKKSCHSEYGSNLSCCACVLMRTSRVLQVCLSQEAPACNQQFYFVISPAPGSSWGPFLFSPMCKCTLQTQKDLQEPTNSILGGLQPQRCVKLIILAFVLLSWWQEIARKESLSVSNAAD